MATHTYDFVPGDTAYAVIDTDCVKEVVVLQYTFETYTDGNGAAQEEGEYLVKYANKMQTAFVLPTNMYATSTDALNAVDALLSS